MLTPLFSSSSPINRIDPRLRLILALFLSVLCVLINSFSALLPLGCAALLLTFFSKPFIRPFCKRLFAVNLFLAFLWIFTPFSVSGTPCFSLGPLHASYEGILLTTGITLKANIITLFFIPLIASMDTTSLAYALNGLHFPPKLTFMLLFSERSFYLLFQEWKKLTEAAKLRSFTPKCSLHSYKTIASLLAILILRSFDQSQRAYDALRLRGFNGVFFGNPPFHLKKIDVLFLVLFFLLLLVIASVQVKTVFLP